MTITTCPGCKRPTHASESNDDGVCLDCLDAMGMLSDEHNPEFLFSTTHDRLLVQIASGAIDAKSLAVAQLASRGLDTSGKWVGFKS